MTEPRIIKPTVGRVVYFHRGEGMDHIAQGDQPLAAIIAYVHHDRMVNLQIINSNGVSFGLTSVQMRQPGDPVPDFNPYCEWMPYQQGQAAKTEAAEAELEQNRKTAAA